MPSRRKYVPPPAGILSSSINGIRDRRILDPVENVVRQLNAVTKHVGSIATPSGGIVPQGPTDVLSFPSDGAILIRFRPDRSGPIIRTYKIYRSVRWNASGPVDPSGALCIASLSAVNDDSDTDYVVHYDGFLTSGGFTVSLVGDVRYWVRSFDDRGIPSAYIPAPTLSLTAPVGYWENFINIANLESRYGLEAHLNGDVSTTSTSYADVTGLTAPAFAGVKMEFEFFIPYLSAATTTGSRWSVNASVAETFLSYVTRWTLTATTESVNYTNSYENPAAANASSLTAGNVAHIKGVYIPSADTSLVARFATEVGGSAITAKAGASVRYRYLL